MKIHTVGGYEEIGKNMTCIESGDEAVIIDMGLDLEPYIKYTDNEDIRHVDTNELRKIGAIPDDISLEPIRNKVIAICPSHAHLDHIGAIIFLSNKYNCPIICTPFTAEVIKAIVKDEKVNLRNEIQVLNTNSKLKLSKNITVEFINITHSTPQAVMVALHTNEGTLVYSNDFKFDNNPTLGKKPNYKRLEQLGKQGVKVLIVDCTNALKSIKTPSETVAKEMLRDVLLGVDSKGKAIIVTTFSSHLARLKSIIEFGRKLNRKVVLLGRSLSKYVQAGENINLVNFSKEAEIAGYGKQIKKKLREIQKDGIEKYLLVVTGHQGEPKSTLVRMTKKELPFNFQNEDHVVFSCTVIPSEVNIQNRHNLESDLKNLGVRIFSDIHVSGHAAREDLRDLLAMIQPENIIPSHGTIEMKNSLKELAIEKGFKKIHMVKDGDLVILK